MKTIDKMFPLEVNFKDRLNDAGIKIPDSFRFSDVNIVIGKNGAGKTRFLRVLKSLYESESMGGNVDLMYGYFPGLSDRWVEKKTDLPEHELREFLDQPDVSFDDFFKEIETQSTDFLTRLLDYHSRRQKQTNENILKKINDFFYAVTEKKLVISQENSSGIDSSLEKKLGVKPEIFAVLEPDGTMIDLKVEMDRFSPGERLLLYMAIFFALRRTGTRKKIIILDEPETHLHPQALLEFTSTLTKSLPHTTVWIATHSLFLLPEFRFENIVYMENSAVIPRNSSLYETVLTALLGENSEGTRRFFSSLPFWQYVEFLTECFATPKVVDTVDSKDEQVQMFVRALEKQQIRRILDCGGGNGRLGLSLKAAGVPLEAYDIYDVCPSYTGDEFTVYTRMEDIKGPYDCVVMMNFLHEVAPDDWPELFHNMQAFLKPNGNLLFVEVAALTDGEWPNETGYMVLGKKEIATLFNATDSLSEIHIRNKQKSVGMLVPRQLLMLVTESTVSKSIKRLEERAYSELKQIRLEESERRKAEETKCGNDKSWKPLNARRYAFLSQQYINAKIFNDKTVLNHFQKTSPVMSKNELLTVDFKSAKKFIMKDPAVNSELSGGTRAIFNSTIDYYKKNGRMSDIQHARCAEHIQALKRKRAQRQTIDTFLVLLALMEDNDAIKQLETRGIDPFYPITCS